jgi:phospholipid transport system substrate-binding protein
VIVEMIGSSVFRHGGSLWISALAIAFMLAAPGRTGAEDAAGAVVAATGGAATGAAQVAPKGAPARSAAIDARSTPDNVVEVFHGALIEMMKKSGDMSFDERVAYLMPVMDESFDLDFMSAKSVGRQWKELSEADQATWRQKFSELTVSNYAGRFVDYSGEMFSTVGNEPAARDTVMVLTRLDVPGDEAVDMNYRLRKSRDGWRIIDIYLKGTVSELALRRSEYSSTLKRDGFEKLAAAIEKKIAELREDAEG